MKLFNIQHNQFIYIVFILLLQSSLSIRSSEKFDSNNGGMMEYLNNYFGNGQTPPQKEDPSMRFSEKGPVSARNLTTGTTTDSKSGKNNNSVTKNATIEGKFMIQSSIYTNKLTFPEIQISQNEKYKIPLDFDNWRINTEEKSTKENANKFFYFYLSGMNIYYSYSKESLNILDAFSLSMIKNIERQSGPVYDNKETSCLMISGYNGITWKICTESQDVMKQWFCTINLSLQVKDPFCEDKVEETQTCSEKQVNQPIILIPLPSKQCNEHWSYINNGNDWECMCKEGKQQSPIDLPYKEGAITSDVKPFFTFFEVNPVSKQFEDSFLMDPASKMHLVLQDNMIKIFHQNFGKAITMDGAVYQAQEIAFHTPGEHTIEGKIFDMEMQVIFYGQSVGDIGKQIVLCFPIQKAPGVQNKFFDDLDVFDLPSIDSKKKLIKNKLFIPKIFYDSKDTEDPVMKPFSFYTYQGSLPFPPCSENTIVYVAGEPIQLSTTVIGLFAEALRPPESTCLDNNDSYENSFRRYDNNRVTQPRNNRPVFYYDHYLHCGLEKKKKYREPGHYEKYLRTDVHYFYVNGQAPSGLPGSLVVSKEEAKTLRSSNKPKI